jgi:glycogenin glucosyltransferase
MSQNAWVTLVTNDGYAIGALVLAQSLHNVETAHRLHVLFTSGVSAPLREQLKSAFDDSTEVDVMDSADEENLALIERPELGVTFTKLHCWRLTQYSKCVFLDADTLVCKNCDELFEHPEISAAPDIGWPDYFNTGVFVFVPSLETYRTLLQFALTYRSFDGGDQGLLNQYFHYWRESGPEHRLSFIYNVTGAAIYGYAAAVRRHKEDIKITHFLGKQKPWIQHYGSAGGVVYLNEFLQQWQEIYTQSVQPHLPASLKSAVKLPSSYNPTSSLPSQLVQSSSNADRTEHTSTSAEGNEREQRYEAWEHGKPDYEGQDSFENIAKAIEKSLNQ